MVDSFRSRSRSPRSNSTNYDATFFNQDVDRSSVYSVKHGLKTVIFGKDAECATPLSIADMDLPCCPEIINALRKRTEHPTFGYTFQPSEIWHAAQRWLRQAHSWEVDMESFVFCPGVVVAAAACLWAFTKPGDTVLLLLPLYEPLQKVVEGAGRVLRTHHLTLRNGRYELEEDRLEKDLKGCRLLLFCNPHNPGGRAWHAAELKMVAALCLKEGVQIVSDEIWADWCLFGNRHRPLAMEASQPVVTLMAPTKTWNLAGLHCSFLVIQDKKDRDKYLESVAYAFLHYGSTFATESMLAAYEKGKPWLDGVKKFVEAQLHHAENFFHKRCARTVVPLCPEATYLLWLDCKGLEIFAVQDPAKFFLQEANVLLSPGVEFGGTSTQNFVRMNVATSRSTLDEALERMAAAVERRQAAMTKTT